MAKKLSKEAISFWRDTAQSKFFEEGLTYLRRRAPQPSLKNSADEMMRESLKAAGWNSALDEIEEVLTQYEKEAPENPGLPELERNT